MAQQVWLREPDRVPASQKGFEKQNSIESSRSRVKSELDNKVLSLCLLIKLRTIAEPEVGLKSNGLNKHYYLNRSPPPQFTGGQML